MSKTRPFRPTIRPRPHVKPPMVEPKPPPSGPQQPGPRTPTTPTSPEFPAKPRPIPGNPRPKPQLEPRPGIKRTPPGVKPPFPVIIPRPVDAPRHVPRPNHISKLQQLQNWAQSVTEFALSLKNVLAFIGVGLLITIGVWAVRGALMAARFNPWGAAASTAVFVVFLVMEKSAQAKGAGKASLSTTLASETRRFQGAKDLPTQLSALRKIYLITKQAQEEMDILLDASFDHSGGGYSSSSKARQAIIVKRFLDAIRSYKTASTKTVQHQAEIIAMAEAVIQDVKRDYAGNRSWQSWVKYYESCFRHFRQNTRDLAHTIKNTHISASDIHSTLMDP